MMTANKPDNEWKAASGDDYEESFGSLEAASSANSEQEWLKEAKKRKDDDEGDSDPDVEPEMPVQIDDDELEKKVQFEDSEEEEVVLRDVLNITKRYTPERKDHLTRIHRHLSSLRERRLLCNVIMRSGLEEYPIHAYMLMAHTDAFTRILQEDAHAFNHAPVIIDFTGIISSAILKDIVHYFYYGTYKLNIRNALDMYFAAQELKIAPITRLAEEFVNYVLENRNLFATVMATEDSAADIHKVAWYKLSKNFDSAVQTRAFLELSLEEVEWFLAADTLDTFEYNVFNAAMLWLQYDRTNRDKYFIRVMRQVCFAFMSTEELITCTRKEKRFQSDEDALQLLTNANLFRMFQEKNTTWSSYALREPRNANVKWGGYVREQLRHTHAAGLDADDDLNNLRLSNQFVLNVNDPRRVKRNREL